MSSLEGASELPSPEFYEISAKKEASIEINMDFLYNLNMDKTVNLCYSYMKKCRRKFCGAILIAKGVKL
ncbi:MAG: hypothetical protein QG657_5268 [Acidobacteriota bacterium]|nr:hypothetical protein [Acidobacteriota bacterium]